MITKVTGSAPVQHFRHLKLWFYVPDESHKAKSTHIYEDFGKLLRLEQAKPNSGWEQSDGVVGSQRMLQVRGQLRVHFLDVHEFDIYGQGRVHHYFHEGTPPAQGL